MLRLLIGIVSGAVPGGNFLEYWRLAGNLAHGHGYSLSTAAPYEPTDWRLPAYPLLLVPMQWLGAGHVGVSFIDSVLGVISVGGLLAIATVVFADRPKLIVVAGVACAVFPSALTFVDTGLSENVLLAAGPWFLYAAFLWGGRRSLGWFALLFVSATSLAMARAEDIVVVVIGLLLGCRFARVPAKIVVAALCVVLVVPLGWAVRNDHVLGRFELTDPMYRDAQLLMQVTDGSQDSPMYLRGIALGYDGRANAAERAAYQQQVFQLIEHGSVTKIVKFDAKNFANFPFVPLVWTWALRDFDTSYTLGDSIRNLDFRNGLRVLWSVVLLLMYCLAAIGLVRWWRIDRRRVVMIVLYPVVAVVVAIAVVADPRQWLLPSMLLILPAVEGAAVCSERWQARRRAG